MMKVDYFIVGQGLAGSTLAYTLLKAGKKILIIDKNPAKRASTVAAGIFNPITGRKMVKTWEAEKLFPFLIDFYPKLEAYLGTQFFHKKPIYRPFRNYEEQNDWLGRSSSGSFEQFVSAVHTQSAYPDLAHDEYGGIILKQCGFVNTSKLIEAFFRFFKSQKILVEASAEDMKWRDERVVSGDYSAKAAIYCDGPWGNANNYFSWLPFSLVKGEILEIEIKRNFDFILNRGVFVFHYENGTYKVGATYDNHDLTWDNTEKAKTNLSEKLSSLLKVPYKITNQIAGVRPASKDRRPLIGGHPEHKNLYIFNGFGTKGISLIPYFAEHFVNCLTTGASLDDSVNISRYFSLYYKNI